MSNTAARQGRRKKTKAEKRVRKNKRRKSWLQIERGARDMANLANEAWDVQRSQVQILNALIFKYGPCNLEEHDFTAGAEHPMLAPEFTNAGKIMILFNEGQADENVKKET